MSMRLSRLLFALMGTLMGALSLVILVPSTAFACSCTQLSVAQKVERADLVVMGSIEGRDEGPPKVISSSADPVTYTVAVDEVLKGESGPVTKVAAITDAAAEPDDSILPPTGGPPVAAMALGGLLLAGATVIGAVALRTRRYS